MTIRDQQVQLDSFIKYVMELTPQDRVSGNEQQLILAALNDLSEDFNSRYAQICTTFMEKYFLTLVTSRFKDSQTEFLHQAIYFLIFFIIEFVRRKKKLETWMSNMYSYYQSELAYKKFKTVHSIFIDHYDYMNIDELSQKYERTVNTLETWSNEQKQQFESDLNNKTAEVNVLTTRVEALKATLEKLHTEYNFVGLSHAFENMLSSKRTEKWIIISLLFLFGLILLIVPAYEIYSITSSLHTDATATNAETSKVLAHYLIKIAPFVLFEALFIYFFRIVLQQFYSTKGQIAQLQLRNALCMFIEKHAEFKEGKDEKLFEKFDALIFSPIVTKEDKIPSTLDGLEQLSKLLQPIKNKKE